MAIIHSHVRYPLLALGMLALLTALWAGLIRLGWGLPLPRPTLPAAHGPLMVCGFLGTLIAVERAVALGRGWAFVGPLLTGLGGLSLIVGRSGLLSALLMTLGSLGLVAVGAWIVRHQLVLHTVTIVLGAVLWLFGNLLWLAGWPVFGVVPWWGGFLVCTIAGERLELSRILRLQRSQQLTFFVAIGLYLSGLVLTLIAFDIGIRLSGVGLFALALWLLRHDLARRTVRQSGVTRFIAISLLSGYVWLGVGGLLGLGLGGVMAGPYYDAMLHALFVGFVLAMIFGHAPIIFPAVLQVSVTVQSTFYTPLLVLHLSLLLRVVSDLAGWWWGRHWGGLWNTLAVILFLGQLGRAIQQAKRAAASGR